MTVSIKSRVRIVCGAVRQGERFLIQSRQGLAGSSSAQWEFPGGNVHPGETDYQALSRAFQDRLGARPIIGDQLLQVTQEETDLTVTLVLYRCVLGDAVRALEATDFAWVSPEDFSALNLRKIDRRAGDFLLLRDDRTEQLALDMVPEPSAESALVVPLDPNLDLEGKKFVVKVASTPQEIRALQSLRFQVFYDELEARADPNVSHLKLDMDVWDTVAEHLIVLQRLPEQSGKGIVVATVRLVRRERLLGDLHFYTGQSFDLSPILENFERVVEVGRFCVAPRVRGGRVILMLWKQLADFVTKYNIQAMFGCGSFHGTDPWNYQAIFSYFYQNRLAPEPFRPRVVVPNHVPLKRFVAGAKAPSEENLPPLIRSYLRMGAYVSDAVVIDAQFNTVYLCILLVLDPEHRQLMEGKNEILALRDSRLTGMDRSCN